MVGWLVLPTALDGYSQLLWVALMKVLFTADLVWLDWSASCLVWFLLPGGVFVKDRLSFIRLKLVCYTEVWFGYVGMTWFGLFLSVLV